MYNAILSKKLIVFFCYHFYVIISLAYNIDSISDSVLNLNKVIFNCYFKYVVQPGYSAANVFHEINHRSIDNILV